MLEAVGCMAEVYRASGVGVDPWPLGRCFDVDDTVWGRHGVGRLSGFWSRIAEQRGETMGVYGSEPAASRRGWAVLLLVGILAFWPTHSALAKGCAGSWDYSESSLQNARARLKSPRHPNVLSRVQCGRDVLATLDVADMPRDCPACRREYVGLMRDLIQFVRQAAEFSVSRSNKDALYDYESRLRIKFGDFLIGTDDAQLIADYWPQNFEGLGDAMERRGTGKQFHDEATRHARQIYSDKTFGTWARAIRSCPTWDFRSGRDKDFPALRRTLMCSEECVRALTRIRSRVNEGQAEDKQATSDVLDDLLPAVEGCATGDVR